MAPEIRLTAEWVAAAISGALVAGDRAVAFTGVSIDTRTLAPGELYIAIRGERFDGADFAPAAIAAGASGAVVPRGRREAAVPGSRAVVIEVDDTIAALQALGHAVRAESAATVVAITGSAGKTTTKEVTADFLGERYTVTRNRGNLNNHIGLPLSLIELRRRPDVAVLELGMSRAGEIRALVRIAEPDMRVWTNVGEAHLGFFSSVDAIAEAKAEIFEGAGAATLLVANADDSRIASRLARFAGRVVTFGIEAPADVRATAIVDRGIEGISARISTPFGTVDLAMPLVGRGNLENVLAATAVATELGVPLDRLADRAGRLRAAPRRGAIVRLARGVTVIDDSYNANPTATRQALEVLGGEKQGRRRIAALGEMLELGRDRTALHQDVGRAAAVHVDVLMSVGGEPAAALADAAVAAGLPRRRVRHVGTSQEAADALAALVEPGDLILVKGSRGVGMDRVVDRLTAELA
jgi:UDP-N-acetylmuramoyl-tripeptide--D-alanyl-D-alanine ligase